MTTAVAPATDPLAVFLQNARQSDKVPVPLQSTSFDILIESGLAIVQTTRLFRNAEAATIEATLTFPVPVHAVLFSLDIRIGERRLQATAKAKDAARSTYEEGIEEGKTSILHEELLRGIHMLSVGNIPPGQEIEVKTVWAMPLMMAGGEGHLRIPTTVGQIYGQSPLSDGDDFTWGDDVPLADVTVKCAGAPVTVGGRPVEADPVKVRMNQPIDLTVGRWQTTPLTSRMADGVGIELDLSPAPASSAALSLAILVDRSGSMDATVRDGEAGKATVHDLVVSALKTLSGQTSKEDFIDLWEFSDLARHVGHSAGNEPPLPSLIRKLSPPDGGTEINASLSAVIGATQASSILLITDGKSYALDVQALAGRGKRISVLLVGEDSLEAQVGHLAALSGGDIHVAPKNAVDKVLGAALNSLRSSAPTIAREGSSKESHLAFSIAGMMIRLKRTGTAEPGSRNILERAVAALAASLQLPTLSEENAARFAEAEGLVTHLTSLVLIDEVASGHDAIPLRRRVPLAPSENAFGYVANRRMQASLSSLAAPPRQLYLRMSDSPSPRARRYQSPKPYLGEQVAEHALMASIDALADLIDWDEFGEALANRQIDQLAPEISAEIKRLADSPAVKDMAVEEGVEALHIVILLLAKKASGHNNRSASRVVRRLSKNSSQETIKVSQFTRRVMSFLSRSTRSSGE